MCKNKVKKVESYGEFTINNNYKDNKNFSVHNNAQ